MGRGRANWVNIKHTEALDAVYQVSMDLSQWLGLHSAVNIYGVEDACFQEHITYPKQCRFLEFVQILIQLIKAKRTSEPDF